MSQSSMIDRCWEFTGARDPKGYGRVSQKSYGQSLVHRVVYEQLVGPIPTGLVLDHLCRNTSCYNPRHLEPVTQRANSRRGIGRAARFTQTHCIHGHLFDEKNTYVKKNGTRDCRRCHADIEARRRAGR